MSKDAFWQVNKKISKLTDNDTAILLADLISKEKYFEDRGQLIREGYFFNTVKQIKDDCNINKDKQRSCLNKLKNLGIVEVKMMLVPKKRHYRINHENLINIMTRVNENNSCRKSSELEGDNNDDYKSEIKRTINKNKDNKKQVNENKSNIHIKKLDESVKNKFYSDRFEIEKHLRNYEVDNRLLKTATCFFEMLLEYKGIKHGILSHKAIQTVIQRFNYAVLYIDDISNIDKYIAYYFTENRKYYSLQEFIFEKNFEVYATRLSCITDVTVEEILDID